MALRSLSALARAIRDVKQEAGNNDEHKALVEALDRVHQQIGGAPDAGKSKSERDSEDDDYSFDAAEKRHVAINKEQRALAASAANGGEAK
jgi:hypothetical protein